LGFISIYKDISVYVALTICFAGGLIAQEPTQVVKGTVADKESRTPLAGANVVILDSNPLIGTSTDATGRFRLNVKPGRVSLRITFLGYEETTLQDLLVSSGKETDLYIEMRERVLKTQEVIVSSDRQNSAGINQMAAISTQTIRTEDALRYAGGYYDPSRIVNAFAGVATSNNDESNDIVIRGNSSRGLLWRLEGIEIPNPNHFGDGQGGSGGFYSAITSNVISNFDFFTGAFPAEYGNAVSGVMDLSLRKGNSDHYEFAFQTGMIGAEVSAEGPLKKENNASFLFDARYVNFGYLDKLNIIDLGSINYPPRSKDAVFNINLPTKKAGTFNLFGFYGSSALGQMAIHDRSSWKTDNDRWEELQQQDATVVGLKQLLQLNDGSGYIKSIVAFTGFNDKYSEGYVDSSYSRKNSYHHNFNFPALRFSFLLNKKLSPAVTFRSGVNLHLLDAGMNEIKLNSSGAYDNLVSNSASGVLFQLYSQIQNRITENLEINAGLHLFAFSVNKDYNLEPRLGLRWQFLPGKFINAGLGLHSRTEAFPVYYRLVKNSQGLTGNFNEDLSCSKSFQVIAGTDLFFNGNIKLRAELYNQHLFKIPVIVSSSSTYSAINSAEELPSSDLSSKGVGYNRGMELTIEKSFSHGRYFLFTASLLDSKYKAGNGNWYNTYYNTSLVSNFLAGKDFYFGKDLQNCFGVNVKLMFRGGYRYTPVDEIKTMSSKKIVYNVSRTYSSQLPEFIRIDGGIHYRRNSSGSSWVLMLDVQNVTDRKNVFRKRFSYSKGQILMTEDVSVGIVPVFNFRIEF
jgi:hypothetical protein